MFIHAFSSSFNCCCCTTHFYYSLVISRSSVLLVSSAFEIGSKIKTQYDGGKYARHSHLPYHLSLTLAPELRRLLWNHITSGIVAITEVKQNIA